jgi:hypothetical protein
VRRGDERKREPPSSPSLSSAPFFPSSGSRYSALNPSYVLSYDEPERQAERLLARYVSALAGAESKHWWEPQGMEGHVDELLGSGRIVEPRVLDIGEPILETAGVKKVEAESKSGCAEQDAVSLVGRVSFRPTLLPCRQADRLALSLIVCQASGLVMWARHIRGHRSTGSIWFPSNRSSRLLDRFTSSSPSR